MSKKSYIITCSDEAVRIISGPDAAVETEEEIEQDLKMKLTQALYTEWWDKKVRLKIKEDSGIYLNDQEKKQHFLENTQSLKEGIKTFKNKEIEDLKQNPEKYIKQFYKNNLQMKKVIANQSLKIRLLEKENEYLAEKLAAELNKTIFDRIKNFVINFFKRGKNV